MPISEDLLNPIPGPNPSGQDLRYVIYDTIKEARREEDEAPQGDWAYERKRADYPLVLRLSCEALGKQTKDLQLAVWAAEASLNLDGLPGLQRGLEFLGKLVDAFWDTVYPKLEDGSADLRAGVLESSGGKFCEQLWYLPLTLHGLTWLQYIESRAVGYESDAIGNDDSTRNREHAISEGKITSEMFDAAVAETPKEFYQERLNDADDCLASLEVLNQVCENKFHDDRPSFAPLREALEETRQCIKVFLGRKREEETKPRVEEFDATLCPEDSTVGEIVRAQPVAISPSVSVNPANKEPEDAADAITRIALAAYYLRREQPANPVPYLVVRALRWGELRASLEGVEQGQFEAPSTDVRKRLRGLLRNSEWDELLDAAESVMASPCGRGWLDLQRYSVKACEGLGDAYMPVSVAISSELSALLSDYPQLLQSTLNDETPAANPETQSWLTELTVRTKRPSSRRSDDDVETASHPFERVTDTYELANKAASSGHIQDAIEMLEREATQERSGRGRFRRKMQLAEICMSAGYKAVALPILNALAEEIDQRKLEDWEDPGLVIHTLELLYQCMDKLKGSAEQKEKIYARICRLGPARALELAK